ncbi:MBOAT family O-acyltransferase [Metabacillus halosaccharovorans]|uniref:MBOAT family O-acyltransferase n=1 Tax=Metabacillus halosaccharovorans TaxID=930124 RepID=UPI001C1FE650|nr:MBOAT family O-acyltransferase [Metabacillus halosaccharovorans]MBU7594466.1 MBOAT family protein [Metabacillus halosaccharovorans]
MLFNSFEYIFFFLPIVLFIYFFLNRKKLLTVSKLWLLLASLFFYSWWNIIYLPLILVSILFNYFIGILLTSDQILKRKRLFLTFGIVSNICLLGYFKYSDFFISNVNSVFHTNFNLLKLALPLAISFFTFQQIAYLVDSYRKETKEFDFLSYGLFVTFFPQLIAGPIVHHKEIMPQFNNLRNKVFNYRNQAMGIFIFSIGLFKKVILADTFSIWATEGFDTLEQLSLIEGWVTSLSFTFQIYFDFSGYMDMAMGAALLFNIRLPLNFKSPYKGINIQDTWNRWHMTLGQFLYKYIFMPFNKFLLKNVFKPLGLKKYVRIRTYLSLLTLFLVSGIWHGAGWTFIFWGFLHGSATVIHHIWKTSGIKMNKIMAWVITFNFVNFTMIFFRAQDFHDAIKVIKGMVGLNGIIFPDIFRNIINLSSNDLITYGVLPLTDVSNAIKYLLIAFIIILCFKNSNELMEKFKPSWKTLIFTFILLIYSVLHITKVSEFLYFNF